jgi:YGGT family
MSSNQQRPPDPEPRPTNVVVTTQAPIRARMREEPLPESTRVEVSPGTAANTTGLTADPAASPLRRSGDGVRQERFAVGKLIDVCWYLLGVLEIVLAGRFFFELTAANSAAGLVRFVLAISQPFTWPFNGIFPIPRDGNNVFDPNVLIAMGVYVLLAWGITRLLAMTIEPPSVS